MRDLDKHPYSDDERRVVDYFWERGIGGGDDPIGFLLASYQMVMAERRAQARFTMPWQEVEKGHDR